MTVYRHSKSCVNLEDIVKLLEGKYKTGGMECPAAHRYACKARLDFDLLVMDIINTRKQFSKWENQFLASAAQVIANDWTFSIKQKAVIIRMWLRHTQYEQEESVDVKRVEQMEDEEMIRMMTLVSNYEDQE